MKNNRKPVIYAINGSPRHNGNTAAILRKVLEGAAECGFETALIHLGDYHFPGCVSCFNCKLKNSPSYGKCAIRDELTPVLDKIATADALVMGTPVYFGGESSLFRGFIERFFFPKFRYDAAHSSLFNSSVPVGFVYTMNVPQESMLDLRYPDKLKPVQAFGAHILNSPVPAETLYVCDTWQFDDYSKYDAELFDVEAKAAARNTLFAADCERACKLGQTLAGHVLAAKE